MPMRVPSSDATCRPNRTSDTAPISENSTHRNFVTAAMRAMLWVTDEDTPPVSSE